MADDTQQQPQPPPDLNAAIQALIQQQLAAASGQGQQVQLPSTTPPPSQYSNDPSKGPDLLARIGLAIGGGSLPGAPAELRQQMGKQALLNFGIGLLGAGRFSTPGEALAGGLRGAQSGLLGSEAAQAGQQEYALNAQAKLAELGMEQQKNRTAALTALVPLLQMQGRLGLPSLFGGGGGAGGPGGDTALTGDWAHDQPIIAQRESGGDPTALNYVAKADPTAWQRGATATGKYQMVQSTWDEGKRLAGIDASKYPTARDAPEAVQDQVAKAVYDKHGTAPWDASKFGSNWVKQPDGTYQLVKGAPPPASAIGATIGPGSAPTGPYKPTTAPPAASGPPGVQMGGPPPAPPGGASGGAPYQEAGAGIGRVLTGTEGVPGRQQVTVAPPPSGQGAAFPAGRLQTTGRVPGAQTSAADAILQGIQTAQATPLVRGTGEEAGPSSAVATLAQPPAAPGGGTAAQPGWGAQVGSYNFGGPVGPVTVPPAPQQQPAQPQPQPPSAQPAQPPTPPAAPAKPPIDLANTPDLDLTPEQYGQKHHTDLTPEQVRALTPGVSSEEAQATAQNVLDAKKQLASTQANYTRVAQGNYGQADVNRAMDAVNKAQEALATAQTAYGVEVDKLQGQGADRLAQREKDEQARLTANYKTNVSDVKAAATASQAAIRQKAAESEIASDQGIMQGIDKTTESAHDTLQTLEAAKALSVAAGNKSNLCARAGHGVAAEWVAERGRLQQARCPACT
jgi:hypothetical protein